VSRWFAACGDAYAFPTGVGIGIGIGFDSSRGILGRFLDSDANPDPDRVGVATHA